MRRAPRMSSALIWRRRLPALVAVALFLAVTLVGLQRPIIGEARVAVRKPSAPPDWLHIRKVMAALKARPPTVPVVYLLGGSAARESTISDESWRTQVRHLGGPPVRTYTLGSDGQTYAQDITIVDGLPAVPSIVLIGVGLGRYVRQDDGVSRRGGSQPTAGPGTRPQGRRSTRGYDQHHYSVSHILTDAQKREFVLWWRKCRYPTFERNFAANAATLDQLIATCLTCGLHPVLLELPLNLPIVGHILDRPRTMYRDSCRELAKKYGIPKIDFLSKVGLVSGDFYDMSHLVEPGRVKWQLRLSKTVVSLLQRYHMTSP
jgi:hypothetical protein